ncbi:MAG: hypothetical protein ACRYGK_04280 [Janthinobacterium lividum]
MRQHPENAQIMDWIPVVLVIFKVFVFGAGMFFAIKWHYDKGTRDKRAFLRLAGKAAAIFVLSLVAVGLVTFALSNMMGLSLRYP